MIASPSTLGALEFPALLALVASEARTDLGAARLIGLRPATDRGELEAIRRRYEELSRLAVDAPFVPSLDAEFGALLSRLDGGRSPLEGVEILLLARLLRAAAESVQRIRDADPPCPELARSLENLADPAPLLAAIDRVLDRRGRVRDDASPRLAELAATVRTTRDRLYARLERVRGEHGELFVDEITPLRGGRLLLVLPAGGRGRVPGLVHGRSATGRSFYFEPLEVVEENNTLQTAHEELEEERQRLLAELRAALAADAPLVRALAGVVAELDALEAAGRYADAVDARLPELASAGRFRLVAARHPLLDPRLASRRERVLGAGGHTGEVVPLDLELGGATRVLVVTGPNAGGKTVALKTLGLAVLAAQCGLPVPCASGSELALVGSLVATVGDDQDLLAERSTFSGRLLRLAEAWRAAGPGSLALLDELGSGTDPEEGAALAQALVERLLDSGGLGLVTTHLAAVALAALDHTGAACAAMEFDPRTGEPTYRILPGAPGASEAIALARRLGLPAEWIARAEALVGDEQRELRRVLAELEAQRGELAEATLSARDATQRSAEAAARLERARSELEAERRTVGARLKQELAQYRERVGRELTGELERLRAEFRQGRRKEAARQAAERLLRDAPTFEEVGVENERPARVGREVRHRALGWTGRLESVDGDRAEVHVGGKRVRCSLDELVGVGAGGAATEPASRRTPAEGGAGVGSPVAAELLLLGFRVEEGIDAVDNYLDQALRAGRGEVRIVHGHGTGRLRDAVREHLRRHPAVAGQRPGAANEGGNGATVVTLRE